jgi:putative hydrolase of the HAD superfamily
MEARQRFPDAIVFDLWYTLICPEHHRPPGVRTVTEIPSILNLEVKPFVSFWETRLPAMYRNARPLHEYAADYLSSLGRTMSQTEVAAFDGIWTAHDKALAFPRPQVTRALSQLRQREVRLGLLSNAHEREIREWSASPLSPFFQVTSFSCHTAMTKPDGAAYRDVLHALGVEAIDAIYVGDGASDELRGARDADFGAVVFMRGLLRELRLRESEQPELESISDFTIDDIGELAELLASSDGSDSSGRLTAGRSRRAAARG